MAASVASLAQVAIWIEGRPRASDCCRRIAARALNMASERSDVDATYDEKRAEVEAADRPPWGPVGIVLVVELCERLTYYTLAVSQKTYLNKRLGYTASSAAAVNSVFTMLCYLWCLPGGIVADVIGRYKVIVSAASTYALGTLCRRIRVHGRCCGPLRRRN